MADPEGAGTVLPLQRHAVDTFGQIDVVVANAGIGEPESDRFLNLKAGPDGEPTVSVPATGPQGPGAGSNCPKV